MPQDPFIAVRVFGEFIWPPISGATGTAKGTASIVYFEDTPQYGKACFLWEPPSNNPGQTITPTNQLPDFNDADTANHTFCVWLENFNATLSFYNGWFYEQFRLPDISSNDLRSELAVKIALAVDGASTTQPTLVVRNTGARVRCAIPRITAAPEVVVPPNVNSPRLQELPLPAHDTWSSLADALDDELTNDDPPNTIDQANAFLSIIGEDDTVQSHTFLPYHEHLRAGATGVRYELGPIYAHDLDDAGALREENFSLVVVLDGSNRTRVHSGRDSFFLVATISWPIKPGSFWSLAGPTGNIDVQFFPEVKWRSDLNLSIAVDGIATPHGLLRAADGRTKIALTDIAGIEGGLLDCALPDFGDELTGNSIPFFALAFSTITGRQSLGEPIEKSELRTDGLVPRCISALSPFSAEDNETYGLDFTASLPNLDQSVQFPGPQRYQFRLVHGVSSKTSSSDGSRLLMYFHVFERNVPNSSNLAGQVSGLSFDGFGKRLLVQGDDAGNSSLAIYLPLDEVASNTLGSRVKVDWEWWLGVSRFVPVRGDVGWGDRQDRSVPLLVRPQEGSSPAQETAPFVLQATESISPRDDRHLVCNILENSLKNDSSLEKYTLLARQPWSVLRFARTPLTALGDEANAIVATYDSDERTWLFKLVSPEYHFEFQPQAIGESADKPRYLELHDINAFDPPAAAPPLAPPPPYPQLRQDDVRTNPDNSLNVVRPVPLAQGNDLPRRSYLVECRFGPSLDLWVKPSDLERGYFLAEWNAAELFRQKNDFGLGVALRALRGEFLYGLAVGVDPTREDGLARIARVAELEALTGILPQETYGQSPISDDVAHLLSERWRIVRAILMARHERLEVWTPAYDQPRPFVPSRFEAGASFALRTTALLRNPTLERDDLQVSPLPTQANELRIKNDRGLSGGALWPIESRPHWQALQSNPSYHEGRIERIAISPTGGDADQSASFMEGLVTIASETRSGFVQRQRVEILGRIGVFWNRAKHVVIYDRTVNPSEQFAPEIEPADTFKWHLSRSRRAVIRKVMEYIELLEPVRGFPDDTTAKATSCGFLDSVRMQKIIFVDSAWGHDIEDPSGAQGYVIPLWNPTAARKRPNVYPFPNVTFVTLGEGKEDRPLVPRQCANPENVYFYAQAYPIEGDTNKWAPVFDVDYGRLENPVDVERAFAAGGNLHGAPYQGADEVPVGRKPSPHRVLPGHHRFTWRLLPDSARTTLNATYGAKPVYGNVESITFSRNTNATLETDPNLEIHKQHAEGIATFSMAAGVVTHHLAELKQLASEFGAQTKTAPGQQAVVDTVADQLVGLKATLASASAKLATFSTQANDIVTNVLHLDQTPLNCNTLKQRLASDIHRKLLMVAHEIDQYQDTVLSWVTNLVETPLKTAWDQYVGVVRLAKDHLIRAISDVLVADAKVGRIISSLLASAHTDVQKVLGDVELSARIVHGIVADIDDTLALSARRLQDIVSTCGNAADWTASRYDRVREQIREELSSLPLQLNSVTADFSQRLAAELGPAGWVLAQELSHELASRLATLIDGLQLSVKVTFDQTTPAAIVTPCVVAMQNAQKDLSNLEARLRDKLNTADAAFQNSVAATTNQIQQVVQTVLTSAAIVPALIESLGMEVIDAIDTLWTQNKSIGNDLLKKLKDQITSNVPRLGELITSNKMLEQIQAKLLEDVGGLCNALQNVQVAVVPANLRQDLEQCLTPITNAITNLQNAADDVAKIKNAVLQLETDFLLTGTPNVRDTCLKAGALGQVYTARVMESFSRVFHSSMNSAPSNVLRLMAAATAAPEIAQLQSNLDRMRCAYDDSKVQITKIRAALSKLGDALKALGIDIPTDELTEKFEIPQEVLKNYDISKLFPNFAGLNLRGLLPDVKVPDAKDAIRISHDFDRKQFRAWVQVDVKYPIKGRKELYSFGPFAVYFRDTTLTGIMLAEASQDSDGTQTTARSQIDTHIDVDVGGETMLSLEKVAVHYEQGSGLKFEFDPKSIRLHAALQFVQDTLGGLIGDEIGGLQIIKNNGIPVGLQHVFTLPTISIMAGTSGISNIQLSNVFQLLAYPDFVITNRFNLSRPELPFIFSFFIVGGNGFIIIDATYRPLDSSLTVGVECAAGGSASLGLALGPVSGSVFIAFDLVITYRKTIGGGKASGDGLTVSVMLVIAGNVSLWGIAEVFLGILLRISYRESGAIDALGSLSVSVRLCRFITLSFSTSVQYQLRNGRSETTTNSSTSVSADRVQELKDRAKRLEDARA